MKHIRTSYACLGLAVLMLPLVFSGCGRDKPIPVPVDIFVPDEIKDFLYFEAGSQWIYQSDDGLYDTVTLTNIDVDTFRFVDDDDNLLSRQEYFFIDYKSSYINWDYQIYRNTVAPTTTTVLATIKYEYFGSHIYLRSPCEVNSTYNGATGPKDKLKILDKTTTMIDGDERTAWRVFYEFVRAYNDQDIEITLVEGIGVYELKELNTSRTWSLISSTAKKL